MAIRARAFLAPLILICYPTAVVCMFLIVGVLTRDTHQSLQKDAHEKRRSQVEKSTVNK